ncbi:MAG TPA: AGE family epimerase/isomerase [Bacteroidales bacterium]|nr:AGE family epimerase/isomerase [Bacteroidales bacterium]
MKNTCNLLSFIFAITVLSAFNLSAQTDQEKTLINRLGSTAFSDLTRNILPWWSARMTDNVHGGFYGRIDANDSIYPDAGKGGILNARILWTYSAAYRVLKDTAYLAKARRAMDYIARNFIDPVYGGAYLSLKFDGTVADSRKQVYTLSFFIYGLSEYSRATGDRDALEKAKSIYMCIEKYAADRENGGYFEVFTRDWKRSHDRLIGESSDLDEKTMNTHLHLLESYTSLYRLWPDENLKGRLLNLITLFGNKIIDGKTSHLVPFLDRKWNPTSPEFSYGHDIECSWLLCEAAGLAGDNHLKQAVSEIAVKIADAASEGLSADGSMATGKNTITGEVKPGRSWWEQAETVVGYLNAYEITHIIKYLSIALKCQDYISRYLVDKKNGGWFSEVTPDGKPGSNDKAGFWVCPYHNGRMCLELIERTKTFDHH